MWRPSSVKMDPGCRDTAVMPKPCSLERLSSSLANRMLAVLDWPYAFHGPCRPVYHVPLPIRSSKSMPAKRCAREDTVTTRDEPASFRQGSRRPVSAKWPRWLVPSCISNPSSVSMYGQFMTPALLSSTCMGLARARNSSAKARMLASEARSSFSKVSLASGNSFLMSAIASSPLDRVLQPMMTSALALPARMRAHSFPIPQLAPVMTTTLPSMLTPRRCTTSSAVDFQSNPEVLSALRMLREFPMAVKGVKKNTGEVCSCSLTKK
mmetsp:Transcript_9219/g.23112  ORF Transcript_9219/g.23112 Transcript_9219/m.23112 type:complete len:266 (-) Transcript_9219:106-903(-)